jgi:16S rRNA A1518/A1519 N6-dimethyltransferase RsmA/KsgA/DIM1 with predicted DNA glycosylase/AP lyase activity
MLPQLLGEGRLQQLLELRPDVVCHELDQRLLCALQALLNRELLLVQLHQLRVVACCCQTT